LDKEQSLSAWGAATTGAGAAVLATAATACCVPILAPLLISVLGVTGAVWAAGLKPYGLVILGVAGLLLAYGFWTVYRRPVAAGEACSMKRPVLVRWVLWFSALLWLLALAVNVLQILASRIG